MTTGDDSTQPKISIYARVDPEILATLDKLGEAKRPKAKRSQMIELAVIEYVERHAHEVPGRRIAAHVPRRAVQRDKGPRLAE